MGRQFAGLLWALSNASFGRLFAKSCNLPRVAGGIRMGGRAVGRVVGGAEELYVALCTIGPALDERVREKRAQGRYLEMLLLDELGSWAVDQVRQQLYERIEA